MSDATGWLFSLQRFGVEPGLERMVRMLDDLGRPDEGFRTVLVGGTNGKGATAGALAEMLRAGGRSTGRFVSPHLSDPGERIVRDGRPASAEEFEALAAAVRPAATRAGATFFEVVTAMACLAFAREDRTAVFEVGLGGRWDATNALDPVHSVVTNVALDHTAVLGGTVGEIAREKAGILRPGRRAWTAASGEAERVLRREAERIGAPLRHLGRGRSGIDASYEVRSGGWNGIGVTLEADGARTELESPLLGTHQGANLALAALAARDLGVGEEAIRRAAATFVWPGRLELVDGAPAGVNGRVLLDGAHNPAAATALARALGELSLRPHLVLGTSSDKDAAGVLAALAPSVASVRFTRALTSPRALDPGTLREEAAAVDVEGIGAELAGVHHDPREAVHEADARASRDGSAVLIAGSLYLVGELRPWLRGEAVRPHERWQ